MKESRGQQEEDRKVNEVKTFPVPSSLREIKNNIFISDKTPSRPHKEQIINQAFKFHSQGNLKKAATYYQYFINQGFQDHRVFSNFGIIMIADGNLQEAELYTRKAIELKPNVAEGHANLGNILKDLGNLQEAESSYRKAIKVNPYYANAHLNLGSILIDLGNLREAELSTRKAIELNPDDAIAHSNLGSILRDLGNLLEAELSTRKAIELNPHYADAYSNLGSLLIDLGKSKEALSSYIKVININPKYTNIYNVITTLLKNEDPYDFDKSQLKEIFNLLLEKNDIPHKELSRVFSYLYGNELIINLKRFELDFVKKESFKLYINEKPIINTLKKIPLKDIKLEKILTEVRKYICHRIAKNREEIDDHRLNFILALGAQCFINEYVYSFTKQEKISINKIINTCINGELNETNIAILSCYLPLYNLLDQIPSLNSFISSNKSIKEIIILQISEPLKEIELSKNMKKLGKINNYISKKVKSQYEENPYPRWLYSNPFNRKKLSIAQAINNEIEPNYISQNVDNNQLKVLIAGCGTGQQILQAQRYKNADIKSIDLSLSSLSYAKRKINELEINNVELIQMDILEINLLEERFDIIECSGVLHHMEDPLQGLKALLSVLKENGFLKLGLYSEAARKNIVEARKYISRNNLQSNEDNIREFRETIFSEKIPKINSLVQNSDFYTLSSCRDLCFHTQEHRFTIHELEKTLQSNGLEFLGFLIEKPIKSLYKKYFPQDHKQINLQNWAKFEEKHPNTFTNMYQFWVSKGRINNSQKK